MRSISEWLQSLGLDQYAQIFVDNYIDLEVLPDLSDAELKELGVPLGHRKKLLKAIAKLNDVTVAAPSSVETVPRRPTDTAERRQLTVMFCDLVGSTALSQKLDPETLRDLMRAYQKTCGVVIGRYDGHVAQYLGDGLMVYFGWPRAHEDDAERAVRTGLEIVEAMKAAESVSEPLEVRIGIATGLVVVGETGAGDASVPSAAIGETPNVAARMQGLASPGEVLVAPTTYRLVSGVFDYAELGGQSIKGIAEPVMARKVLGEAAVEGRFEAARGASFTALVGRETEIAMLMERWQQACDGEGQVVLLSGEPGIGKSRITQVLRERVAEESHTRLRYQCSPYHTNAALYPIITQIERAAGFIRGESTETRLHKLEALIAQGTDDVAKVAPLIAAILSLEVGDHYPRLSLSPQKQKDETLKALATQVANLAATQPVLMIFEDAHWIDPTTQEVLNQIVPALTALRVLLVITYRPEYQPPWTGQSHVAPITLTRLGREDAVIMVGKVAGIALPDEVLNQIVAKTDGVPLYVEELTKAVLESGVADDPSAHASLEIPATLQDSLMARLDRLSPVREVAQIGATIGREFSHELLAAVTSFTENALADALQQLVKSALIFRKGIPPDATYSFKHALVQDAAYETQLKSTRQHLHTRIATVLKERFPETAINQPEVLARHYEAAGLFDQAVDYLTRAGQRAARRSANAEAIGYLGRGLKLLDGLPKTPERVAQELTLQVSIGGPLAASKGYGAPEVEECFTRARALSQETDDAPQIFLAIWGLYAFYLLRGKLDMAQEMAEQCIDLAQRMNDVDKLMEAHRSLGTAHLYRGNLVLSRAHLEKAIALYDIDRHRDHCVIYSEDPCAVGLYNLAITLLLLGYPEQASQRIFEAEDHAQTVNHAHTTAWTLTFVSMFNQMNREVKETLKCAHEATEFASEQGLFGILMAGTIIQGWALAQMGRVEDGVAQVRQGMLGWKAAGASLGNSIFGCMLADALMRMGKVEEALSAIEDAFDAVQTSGELFMDPEVHRIRAELLLIQGAPEIEVESGFRDAIDSAQRNDSKMFELRAATSMARLWHSQGKCEEAHDLLTPVYGWFTEGFDTADLKDAKALLEELA